MLKKIFIGFVSLIIGFLIYVATIPSDMNVSRELVMKVPADKIFPYINNSLKATEWMPWQETDPEAKMVFSGPDEGVGSKSSWHSAGPLGTGEALVVESVPNKSVKTQLTYTRPMNMSQMSEITLVEQSDGTLVRWTVTGKSNFVCRLLGIFMNMEKMVGDQFEKGLQKLKSITE